MGAVLPSPALPGSGSCGRRLHRPLSPWLELPRTATVAISRRAVPLRTGRIDPRPGGRASRRTRGRGGAPSTPGRRRARAPTRAPSRFHDRFDEAFQLAEVAALVDAVAVRGIVADDRVAAVPVGGRLRVDPVEV